MIAVQRQPFISGSVKSVAGLAAAVALAMVAFASGVSAMEHVASLSQRATFVLPGSFNAASQGDYRVVAPQRVAPQRATTR